jgi:hypothetical protein
MLRSCSLIGLTYLVICWPARGNGEPVQVSSEPPTVPRLSANVTLFVGLGFGFQCHASGNDTAVCSNNSAFAGLRLAPRWRVSSHLGFGLSTGVAVVGGINSGFASTRWWDEQLGMRYYVGTSGPSQLWLDGTLGVLIAREHIPTYQSQLGDTVSEHTLSDWAPVASLALGHDIELIRYFGVAPELRVSLYGLDVHYKGMHPAYDPQTVVTLGVSFVGFGCYQ